MISLQRIPTVEEALIFVYPEINTDELIVEIEDELAFMDRTLTELRATYPEPLPITLTIEQAGALGLAWIGEL